MIYDNGPKYQINNFENYCQTNFQKNLKICVSHFLWQLITYLNEKKKKNGGVSGLVDLAWNAPYTFLGPNDYKMRRIARKLLGQLFFSFF